MTFPLALGEGVECSSILFDSTGRHLLLATDSALLILFDAVTGEKLFELTSFMNNSRRSVEACFSPAGEYVLAGSDDGSIHVWETLTGEEIAIWSGHSQAVQLVRWNPKQQAVRALFALLLFSQHLFSQ